MKLEMYFLCILVSCACFL